MTAVANAGIACELVAYPSIAKFESEFLKATADVLFLNAHHMVWARRAQRYGPSPRDHRQQRNIYTTSPLSPHRIAGQPRVTPAARKKITEALLALAQAPCTKALMAATTASL